MMRHLTVIMTILCSSTLSGCSSLNPETKRNIAAAIGLTATVAGIYVGVKQQKSRAAEQAKTESNPDAQRAQIMKEIYNPMDGVVRETTWYTKDSETQTCSELESTARGKSSDAKYNRNKMIMSNQARYRELAAGITYTERIGDCHCNEHPSNEKKLVCEVTWLVFPEYKMKIP
jgi:outer membrane murein-binding lipoprotein Lpp